jgi:hypothetical protein
MPDGERRRRRGLRRIIPPRRESLSIGPFTGRDVERALKALGYQLEAEPAEDELPIYFHPRTGKKVPVNPDWELYVGDPIFETIRWDMRVSRRTLQRLLGRH